MKKSIIILIAFVSILGCQEREQSKKNIEQIKNDTIVLKEITIERESSSKEMSNKAFFELIHYYQDNFEFISKEEFSNDLLPNFVKLDSVLCNNFNEDLFNEYAKMIAFIDKKMNQPEIEKIFINIFDCHKSEAAELIHQLKNDKFYLKVLNKRYLNDKIFKTNHNNFKLIMPDKRIILNDGKSIRKYESYIYVYLLNNYKITSKKEHIDNLCNYGFIDYRICKFSQQFEQIHYSYSACEEGKGSMTIITLPKVDLPILHKWIELINSIENRNQVYVWRNNGLNYEPKEAEPGCYYSIKYLKNNIKIKIYCGC